MHKNGPPEFFDIWQMINYNALAKGKQAYYVLLQAQPILLMQALRSILMEFESNPKARLYTSRFRVTAFFVAVLFVISVTVTSFAYSNGFIDVTVTDGTASYTLSTDSTDPAEIVRESGLKLGANDRLDLSGFSVDEGGSIRIIRAKTIRVVDDNDIVYCVGYKNLGSTLSSCGIALKDDDIMSAEPDDDIYNGMQVSIKRAFKVVVEADGEQQEIYTTGATVSDLLEEAGVDLTEHDNVSHKLTGEITDGTTITVGRVEYVERVETEDIPFEIVTKADPEMYEGETVEKATGLVGKKEVIYKDKFVDGELISSEVIEESVIDEPITRVVVIGAKKRPALIKFANNLEPISKLDKPSYVELDSNGLPVNYVDYYEGQSTAYTGDPYTASGRVPMQGHVAVNPNMFPYGTELYIVSTDGRYVYGYCIAADTGGFIYNSPTLVDLYLDTEDMCIEWGRRDVSIYVISYPGK